MPLVDLSLLPRGAPLLGLDIGERTIGVAASDVGWMVASALETIARGRVKADAESLARLARSRGAGGLVIGLPLNMDGSEGPRCQSVRQVAANLDAVLGLPYAFWDERLSTVAVERALIEADTSRARRGQVIDKLAAAYILQGALDRLRSLSR